jgi:hypothetical protein
MEWVLVLIGIAYSIWSTYRKEARENEEKQRATRTKLGPNDAADHIFSHRGMTSPSGRRTLGTMQPSRPDPNYVPEVATPEGVTIEDFTSRINERRMYDDPADDIRRTLAEVFGERARPETERYTDYDDLPSYDRLGSYDDRSRAAYGSEHEYTSHFKLNEGLRKDSFKVAKRSAFDDEDPAGNDYDRPAQPRKAITLDRGSLKSYMVMHEILKKPKAVEMLERRHHIARRDLRHGK